jgi:hypothetical protein
MQWTSDRTGRFPERPYYDPDELDQECEHLITTFLRDRHGHVAFPIATDDLTVLIEQASAALDLYADLSAYKGMVQGFTEFAPGRKPLVRISRRLSEHPRYENRLRTTLTHEWGHVWFHRALWEARWRLGQLFECGSHIAYLCQQATMLGAPTSDWAEWQAGYVSGALLMPVSALRVVIHRFLERERLLRGPFPVSSPAGQTLIRDVMAAFAVSADAARVRLLQREVLMDEEVVQGHLFAYSPNCCGHELLQSADGHAMAASEAPSWPVTAPGGVQTWPRLTLLVNSRPSISNAIGVSVTRGMYSVSLAFKRRMQDRFSARFCINQQSHDFLDAGGELSQLT